MTAIYVFGVDYWYFVIYSPCARPEFSDMGFHYIKVERDNYAIKQLLRRAEIATEIKNTKVVEMLAERERRASRRKVTQQEAIL